MKRYGFDRRGKQRYRCISCGRQFTSQTDTYFSGMRYPKNVIIYALTLYYRHKLTLREIAERLQNRGIEVSYVTIHGWTQKFAPLVTAARFKPYSATWHVSGGEVKVKGRRRHLWTVHDSNGNIVSVRLSKKRAEGQATTALRDAIKTAGFKPTTIRGVPAAGVA